MSEHAITAEPIKPEVLASSTTSAPAYWSWRRRFAFIFIQLSILAYVAGAGAYGASYTILRFLGGADREVTILEAIPVVVVLYAIAGLMIAAVLFAVIALIFSRRPRYLGILYVPTAVYAYYMLTM
ncbi:hypothetical protein [Roseimaritima ulvae]|uniref:Uncharacterized protein n=1 Tax=Roseimaritima ulvae TaxID=980254 RepID=A0A5B9QYQ9_9BACT|nr:hypothetical protein [Roseimaritima ulvae]QEG42306.1 hypothetical protein UC8_43400 [Roseimaritima ulvae]